MKIYLVEEKTVYAEVSDDNGITITIEILTPAEYAVEPAVAERLVKMGSGDAKAILRTIALAWIDGYNERNELANRQVDSIRALLD